MPRRFPALIPLFSAVTQVVTFVGLVGILASEVSAADWPMWRYDANRSAASPHALPSELHLQWVREYPPLKPAWKEEVNQDRMPYDRIYEPVVIGSTMLVGSSLGDWVTAIDTRTGAQKWRFFTDGPVRLPPVAHDGKGYFVSDDGYLYCVDVETGQLIWKFRGGPAAHKVLGNGRLISAWPARGGPVLCDGTVYFTASIWPFMGTFIHALNAETGEVVWTNEATGPSFMKQPHNPLSFSGIAPQGALCVIGDRLLVPGGRSVPGCFDRHTGELLYFHLSGSPNADRKLEGGSHVSAIGNVFFNHRGILTAMYDLADGAMLAMLKITTYPVLTDDLCYLSGDTVVGCRLEKTLFEEAAKKADEKTPTKKLPTYKLQVLWQAKVDATGALIKAGSRLYAGGKDQIAALDLKEDGAAEVAWTIKVEGKVARLIAADDRLFAVTQEGRIYAFGPEEVAPKTFKTAVEGATTSTEDAALGQRMLETTTLKQGYCLALGLEDGKLVEAVVENSDLSVIAIDADPEKVARLRRQFQAAGLYGTRVSVHLGDPTTFHLPPYLAVLTISEKPTLHRSLTDQTFIESVYHSMRPYGGVAWLPVDKNEESRQAMEQSIKKAGLENAEMRYEGDHMVLTRKGALPGAGQWTHQYGNIANTSKSDDQLVRLPLGLLWFGGNTHADILPRHGHGPPEQVVNGRLFVEGVNSLSARDVYTGKRLWKREFKDLGTFGVYYDKTYRTDPLSTSYNQVHIPGANVRGTNFVVTPGAVYLVTGGDCLVMDPATGETLTTFSLPSEPDTKSKPTWGYIGVYEDLLIASSQFVPFSKKYDVEVESMWDNYDKTSSRKLIVMDRYTGEVLWSREARFAFRHNAITAGGDKLFCIDSLPISILNTMQRRGKTPKEKARLFALDIKTGQVAWSTDKDIFGTWLSYDKKHDLLLESGRASRDMVRNEPTNQMTVYRAKTGEVFWNKSINHGGPCIIHGETIYLNAVRNEGAAVELLTGEMKVRVNPITGQEIPWTYHRQYGCNSVNATEHMLMFRSGAAGYYDLDGDGGTGNLGGFKSGCTSNLVAADGVLNAPDYTRTCTCTYPNQTSLAMVHMPGTEMWTFNQFDVGMEPVKRIGINFGAPGDRRDPNGTLWLDYPSVGGASPNVPIEIDPSPRFFRLHPLRVHGQPPTWVGASGMEGSGTIELELIPKPPLEFCVAVTHPLDDAEQNADGKVRLNSSDLELIQDGDPQTVGIRFSSVPVPKDAKIRQAYVQFKVDETTEEPTSLVIHGQASDNPARFSMRPFDLSGRKKTKATISWEPIGWPKEKESGADQRTPDLTPILQSIIDRPGWEKGQPVVLLFTGSGRRVAKAFEGDAAGAAKLYLKLEEPASKSSQTPQYTVRLHFAEAVQNLKPGDRVFDVALQGETVLNAFDILAQADSPRKTIVKQFTGIPVPSKLRITLTPRTDLPPVLCGVEVVSE